LQNSFTAFTEPKVCVLGYEFNATDGECHPSENIAEDDIANINCPIGFIYSGSGKSCTKIQHRCIICPPSTCKEGSKMDKNGICREIW